MWLQLLWINLLTLLWIAWFGASNKGWKRHLFLLILCFLLKNVNLPQPYLNWNLLEPTDLLTNLKHILSNISNRFPKLLSMKLKSFPVLLFPLMLTITIRRLRNKHKHITLLILYCFIFYLNSWIIMQNLTISFDLFWTFWIFPFVFEVWLDCLFFCTHHFQTNALPEVATYNGHLASDKLSSGGHKSGLKQPKPFGESSWQFQ